MAWTDAARQAAAAARRVKLGSWDSNKGKGIKYPEKGSFRRESLAHTVKQYRALARGTISAKERKSMGPTVKPTSRLTGAKGAAAWNSFAGTGYRKWGK